MAHGSNGTWVQQINCVCVQFMLFLLSSNLYYNGCVCSSNLTQSGDPTSNTDNECSSGSEVKSNRTLHGLEAMGRTCKILENSDAICHHGQVHCESYSAYTWVELEGVELIIAISCHHHEVLVIWCDKRILQDEFHLLFQFVLERGALGRAVEHSTSDHWVTGSKPGVFMSGALSSFVSLLGDWSVAHKTLAFKKRR